MGKNIKLFLDPLLKIISVWVFFSSDRDGFDRWLNFGRNCVDCNHRRNYSGSDETWRISLSSASAASDRRWHRQHHLDVTSNLIGWLSVTQTKFLDVIINLIGRFAVTWQQHLDVSTNLIGWLSISSYHISTRHFLLFSHWMIFSLEVKVMLI